jgi:hypothetical protein
VSSKQSFANQVRISLIVAKSLLKKSTETGEISQEASDAIQSHLNSAFSIVKQHVNKETD